MMGFSGPLWYIPDPASCSQSVNKPGFLIQRNKSSVDTCGKSWSARVMITSPLSLVVNRRFPLQTFLVYWTLPLSLSSLSLINHTFYSSKYRLLPLSYSPSSSPSSRIQFDVSDLGVKCELGFDLSTNRLRVRFEITVRVDSSVLFVVRLQWLLEGAGLYREWISISVSNFGNCECEVGLIRFGKPYCFWVLFM